MDKQHYSLEFIKEYNPDWATLSKEFETLLFKDIDASLIKARKLTEHLVKEIYQHENIEYPQYANQSERLMILKNTGVIDEELFKLFDRIRRFGNIAAHDDKDIPFYDGLKIHNNLYLILKWFLESYGRFDIQVPEYQDPKPENIEEKIDDRVKNLLEEYLPKFLQDGSRLSKSEVKHDEEDSNEEMPKLHGSRLLFQLNRLRESSQDAVEGYKGLSDFKKYMHISRPIEEHLEKYLMECSEASNSQLILLCGSVGDGKSHLISHLSTKYPELMNQFKIHNDATESFDPKKNSLDTLAEVLEAFSDDQIETSNEKLIVAINLGVLNNFIESNYAETKYTKLKEFILNANIFSSNTVSTPSEHDNFKLLNFSDYKIFELTVDGPVSNYLTQLLQKVTTAEDSNPFYQAYLRDKEEQRANPLLINYEMFSSESVQQKIIQLVIKTIIKDKVIISTRELLNFIYDILVPNSVDELQTSDFIDMLPSLLPNLLFEGNEKSYFLKMLANHDPIHIRIKEVDEHLIELNNSGDFYMFFRDVIFDSSAQVWINHLETIDDIVYLDKDTKRELSELFIRASFLFKSHLNVYFQDEDYSKYMKYLYAFNSGKKPLLQDLYFEIQKAIYLWKGSPKSNYIFIDDENSKIRIAEPLNLKPAVISVDRKNQNDVVERFTTTLLLGFKCEPYDEVHEVEIDYPLYEMVIKVLNGYRLNKKNKEDSIKFIDFIDKLLPYGKQEEEILIKDMENNLTFTIKYNDQFESYSFSRE